MGNLGGIVGPVMLGWVKDTTQSFSGGFYFLAFWAFLAGIAGVSALRRAEALTPRIRCTCGIGSTRYVVIRSRRAAVPPRIASFSFSVSEVQAKM